jgi:hypothetical protein
LFSYIFSFHRFAAEPQREHEFLLFVWQQALKQNWQYQCGGKSQFKFFEDFTSMKLLFS